MRAPLAPGSIAAPGPSHDRGDRAHAAVTTQGLDQHRGPAPLGSKLPVSELFDALPIALLQAKRA